MTTTPARPGARGRGAHVLAPETPHEGGHARLEARGGRARTVARTALVVLVALGLAVAVGAAGGPSHRLTPSSEAGFPAWFAGPYAAVAPGALSEGAFWLLLLAMGVCYVGVLALAPDGGAWWVGGAIVVLHLLFALAPPLLSTDAFGY